MHTVEQGDPDRLEVVYYSQPVPRNLAVLTVLGLVFDRVHFPGVYMPPTTLDEKPVIAEIQRIVALGHQDPNTRQMLQCMDFATVRKHIPDLCVFSGKPGGVEQFEPGVHEVVDELENMVFGPWPEGEIAIHTGPIGQSTSQGGLHTHSAREPAQLAVQRQLKLLDQLSFKISIPGWVKGSQISQKVRSPILPHRLSV